MVRAINSSGYYFYPVTIVRIQGDCLVCDTGLPCRVHGSCPYVFGSKLRLSLLGLQLMEALVVYNHGFIPVNLHLCVAHQSTINSVNLVAVGKFFGYFVDKT